MKVPLALALAASLAAPRAETIVREAEQHFAGGRYEEASRAFEKAFELEPDPKYLYARAQAKRLAGDCETALDLYERFLETKPAETQAEPARINRARCEAVLERQQPPPPPDAEPVAEEPDMSERASAPAPWYRDPWGGGLIGAGTLVAVVGAGILGSGIANDRDAPQAANEDEFISQKEGARFRHTSGAVLLSVGAALMIGGAIRWGLVARSRSRVRTRAAVTSRGAWLTLEGRF